MREVDEITLAYLAGIIDGEAYVGVKKSTRKDSVSPIYTERIQVRMVNETAISLLAYYLGGKYYKEKPPLGRKPLFCWQLSNIQACEALESVLPYLRVKKDQALNVLRMRESKEDPRARLRGGPAGRPMPVEVIEERELIYRRAKELNGRG